MTTVPDPESGRPAATLQVAAMLVACAGYILLLVAGVRELRPFPLPVIALLPAAIAVAALPRWRWPKLLGAFLCAVATSGALVIYRATYDRLADPGQFSLWIGTTLQLSGLVVAVIAGALAGRRPKHRKVPLPGPVRSARGGKCQRGQSPARGADRTGFP